MITKEQALVGSNFHQAVSPTKCRNWRRNGATKVWKTRPNDFRVPVKFGLYGYDSITHLNSEKLFEDKDCPVCYGRIKTNGG